MLDCLYKGGCARFLPLILTPKIHRPEPRPAKPLEPPIVIQLEDATTGENFQPLFREGLMAVRQIMNGTDRAILEVQRDASLVLRDGNARSFADRNGLEFSDGRVREKTQQVDKMTSFADDLPPPAAGS